MPSFDSNTLARYALIVLAVVLLVGLIVYYHSKQAVATTTTEKFLEETKNMSPNLYSMSSPAPVQGNDVIPGEEKTNSDFRAVDFETSKLPSDCFPRDRLSSKDLLPADANSKWAQVNPAGQGDVSNQNFLTAGWAVGINTVSGSLRNANLQIRSEPANKRMAWPIMNSTIEPDLMRRPLEIGEAGCDSA